MSVCMSKKIQAQAQAQAQALSESQRTEKETMLVQKQGIVTILGSNSNHVSATSLRRTLSADMSSKKWLSQNGLLSSMKKIASSEELSQPITNSTAAGADSSSSSEEDYSEETKQDRFQIWNTIHQKEQHEEKPGEFDMWSSILSKKANEEASKLSTYVHPLVRRSKSCLSEKSLEICTESLGSETGSDGFSSYTPSETGDSEEEQEEEKVQITHEEELQVPKHNYAAKKSLPRSFPPPLPSLSPSLHMLSHRDNGRLFLQAVSVPSQNNFCAQRENGRLVLTFADEEVAEEEEEEEEEEENHQMEFEEVESVIEQAPMLSSGIRLALMMNNPIGLVDTNKSPKWSQKNINVVNFKVVDVVQHSPLPPRPRARLIPSSPASGAFNAYEYYWRTKAMAKVTDSSLENNLKSCKDSRRSFLFWEPYCIAT